MGFRRLPVVLLFLVSCLVAGQLGGAPAAVAGSSWRVVRFERVTVRVPASWPVIDLTTRPRYCPLLDVHAVYLGSTGPDPACPAGAVAGKTGAVQLMPVNRESPDLRSATRRVVIDGVRAQTNSDSSVTHTIIDILPAADVEVSLSYGADLPVVRAIQASITVAGAARAGTAASSAGPAQAGPAAITPAALPPAIAQGLYQGAGFDTCAAPSAASMNSWLASPYRAIGIYIGGVNRACAQPNLTANWLSAIQRAGWHYFAFYVGPQATCVDATGDASIVPADAAAEGAAAADDAAQQAQDLGIPAGTPLIYDMEAYSGCGQQVITFLSSWDAELHADGYAAGVYESFSNVSDLVNAEGQITEPDVIHYADWDNQATTASSYMPATLWTDHQRLHQYTGGHDETWGGVTMDVDNDELDVYLGQQPVLSAPSFLMALTINGNGSAEWFATTSKGTVTHSYQESAGSSAGSSAGPSAGTASWSAPSKVQGSPGNLVSNPSVAANQDGRLSLFAINSDGAVVHGWQQDANGNWAWGDMPGLASPAAVIGDPAAVLEPGGDIGVFVTQAGGTVETTEQLSPGDNTGWSGWASIGGSCATAPVPLAGQGGALEVFCATTQGTLAFTALGGSGWQPWQQIAGLAGVTGMPAVTQAGDGQPEVFATTSSGTLIDAVQDPDSGDWAAQTGPAASIKLQGPPVATGWPGGGVAVFGELAGGQLGYAVQQPGSPPTWTGWASLGSTVIGSPAAWLSSSGVPEAAVLDGGGEIAFASYQGGGWTGWTDLTSGFQLEHVR
jgi:hypothetical protein